MENKNWLSQKGHEITDADFAELGITTDMFKEDGFNRAVLDAVHARNVAGYLEQGIPEAKAKQMADKRKSLAIKAAKANGLIL